MLHRFDYNTSKRTEAFALGYSDCLTSQISVSSEPVHEAGVRLV
jgi:hypothetical protein